MYLLGMQLQRVGTNHLLVSLFTSSKTQLTLHPILQTLLPSAHRWTELLVHVPMNSFGILSPFQSSFHSLKALYLFDKGRHPSNDDSLAESTLGKLDLHAPQLHYISGYPDILTYCGVPWAQLNRYRTIFHRTEDLVDLLRRMHNLQTLIAYRRAGTFIVYEDDSSIKQTTPCKLSRLFVYGVRISDFLASVTLPNVAFLETASDVTLPCLQRFPVSSHYSNARDVCYRSFE